MTLHPEGWPVVSVAIVFVAVVAFWIGWAMATVMVLAELAR